MTWLEDMNIGAQAEIGCHRFDEAEMIAFARAYDPRAYYIDAGAARHGPFGRIVASPWYITAMWMRLMMATRAQRHFQHLSKPSPDADQAKIGPSPGFLDLSWPNPVAHGDEITYSVRVHEIIKLKSRPKWGIARNLNEGRNQQGRLVMRFFGQVLMERRVAGQ